MRPQLPTLDDTTVELISRRMAECDPQADVVMAVTCPSCAQQWSESFDIVSFLWTELDAWASRVLDDVHHLAVAFDRSAEDDEAVVDEAVHETRMLVPARLLA